MNIDWLSVPSSSHSYIDMASGKMIVERYKAHESAYIDQVSRNIFIVAGIFSHQVKLIGSENGTEPLQRVFIKLRINVS